MLSTNRRASPDVFMPLRFASMIVLTAWVIASGNTLNIRTKNEIRAARLAEGVTDPGITTVTGVEDECAGSRKRILEECRKVMPADLLFSNTKTCFGVVPVRTENENIATVEIFAQQELPQSVSRRDRRDPYIKIRSRKIPNQFLQRLFNHVVFTEAPQIKNFHSSRSCLLMRGLSHLGRSDATASVEDVSPQRFSRGQKPAITPHTFVEECRSMLRRQCKFVAKCFLLWLLFSLVANFTWAQSETATVSGQVVDPSGLNITGAQVKLVDIDRDTTTSVTTNATGLYTFPSVRPGRYRMAVMAQGFKVVNVTGVTVNVQDHLEQNFKLVMGSVSESITVEGGVALVDTESATVSTVVDRNFAENLPMNGRSFQSLIQLTPGVVLTGNNGVDTGQFSVNGQRANSNYWMVDGVSANIGINTGVTAGSGAAGTLGSTSVLGGTNSLVSVDALQEFRLQSSTYAPEFGRTPGGQISIVTRSGTNQFHGTAFDYLRNDALDANDWFNGFTNSPPLPKAQERQNDFGGTFSGPILKNSTFFFFSYEGLRLRLPKTALTLVPDTNPLDPFSRQFTAQPALLPYMNAFPLPNGPEVLDATTGNHQGVAPFNASYSNPGTLDAYSLRVDHKFNDKLNLFVRYNYSPSELTQRGNNGASLSTVSPTTTTTQTATVGALWAISPVAANDFRFNYSSTDASFSSRLDSFGGAVPLGTLPFPSPFRAGNGSVGLSPPEAGR